MAFAILSLSAAFLPWPVVLFLAVFFIALFSWFWEAIIIGFLLASFYGLSGGESGFLPAFFVLSFGVALFIEEYFKVVLERKKILSFGVIIASGGISVFLLWLLFELTLYK
ncbi:MAG: hypothetical protein A3A10_01425 [Candidatus Tagabacteria bacterium RIFCSPLOWO2_01_FULL_42_9]|uniref:Uncharacterized protein n=1 Tax=Candidatus Tagabacteria bacterium RIFCSPLOWO2_01_FULL_42_9 TaxID=1802296 RepID=A0A1G2LUP2_9BACT|nr:MAG: hypothetical protein A3A10_01425 [Candidatus Tagabacteria bacterium RIFCSPLOWO2_01_FULL_42_9]